MKTRLFGSSGVRGLVNVDLTPTLAAQMGLAVGKLSKAKSVFVARDTRDSGLMLEEALVSGLLSAGACVHCLGVVPTPVLAFLTSKKKAHAGMMITASHNPPQYNGIKIFDSAGVAYDEKHEEEIEQTIMSQSFMFQNWQHIVRVRQLGETQSYVETILKAVSLRRSWHVVVDPGCGAVHAIGPKVFHELGCKVTALNAQPDGFFPARSSEPNAQSLVSLASIVKCLDADLGFAYDGDGDRVAFVDDDGRFVDFDRALAAYAGHITEKNDGGTVVTNVEASMSIDKMVEESGGKVVRAKVGDVYVSKEMKKQRAVFGGEPCGAWIHPQFHYCPDGILSSALLLKAIDEVGTGLAEFVSKAPRFPTLRKNIACENQAKSKVVECLVEGLTSAFPEHKVSRLDGVRLVIDKGWILVRASGTEPLLRLTVEGESLKAAKEIMRKGAKVAQEIVGKVK